MRVKINRNLCGAHLAFCERCLGQFLKYPMGYERQCFEELVDDGREDRVLGHPDGSSSARSARPSRAPA